MKKILETSRLLLREMSEEDLSSLKQIIPNGNDEYALKWLHWCLDSYKKYQFGHWAVVYKETGEMIGSIGISMQYIDDEWKPEIGYHLRKDFQRKGLGKEAAEAVRDYFFENFKSDEIYSYMDIDNIASYKTAESIGMNFLHIYKNCRIYKITRDEWKAMKNTAQPCLFYFTFLNFF